jgi:hypothetical protein
MTHMPTSDQTISLIAGAATLAIALATFLTVREIARQRKASYRPDIVAARQYAYAYTVANGFRSHWSRERVEPSEAEALLLGERYSFTLLNVGIGAAKSITATWAFDLDRWIETLNALAQKTFTSLYIERDTQAETVKISGPDYGNATHMVGNQRRQQFGHLLPASLDQSGIQLDVPPCFLALISLQIAMASRLQPSSVIGGEWAALATAQLSLDYFDVGSGLHHKTFRLLFELLGVGRKSGEGLSTGSPPADFFQISANLEEG